MKKNIIKFIFSFFLVILSAKSDTKFNLGLTSDYVWRGLSFSNHQAAIQGGIYRRQESGIFVGGWSTNWSKGNELDLYVGHDLKFKNENDKEGITFKITHYQFLQWTRANSLEISSILHALDCDFGIYYLFNYFESKTPVLYLDLTRSIELTSDIFLDPLIGYNHFNSKNSNDPHLKSYFHYSLGLKKQNHKNELGIYYSNTDRKNEHDNAVFFMGSFLY